MDEGNRPQLVHTPSQQSIAASSDYYSFSNASINSERSKITVIRYQTPPSRAASPAGSMANGAPRGQAAPPSNAQQAVPISGPPERSDIGSPTPGDDTPYIRFAIDQLTRDEEVRGEGRRGTVADLEDYPVERIVPNEALEYFTPPSRQPQGPQEQEESDRIGDDPNGRRTASICLESHNSNRLYTEVLIAAQPPEDGYRYTTLHALPYVLRPLLMAPLILICLCMIAALVFCNVRSEKHGGLWSYEYFGGSRYFVFEFLPQLIAILIVIWVFVVQAAVYRIAPLYMLARTTYKPVLQKLSMISRNFVLPDFSHFEHGKPLIGACLLIFWLTNLIVVPLQSCLFQPKWYSSVDEGEFQWTIVRPIAWTLVALYALLTIALTAIVVHFNSGDTGLQWDPVCIADIIPLIQKSNILHDFDETEISTHVEDHLPRRNLRLGYWQCSEKPDIFYGLGEDNTPARQFPEMGIARTEKTRVKETVMEEVDVERQQLNGKNSFERNLHSPYVRFRWAPWFLKDTFVVGWIVVAIVLLIAFIVVSFVQGRIRSGFLPLLSTITTDAGFSPSNFLYSFIPALLGNLLFLAWQPIDVYFRVVQPFSSLSSPDGTSAEASLLSSYNACLPFEVTVLALSNRHYKVAYTSLISVISIAIPVLAGGVFMARWYTSPGEIRISAYMPAYYALIGFVTIYALSFIVLWPRRKRYLPHKVYTYADVISFLYQSPLLADKIFREPKSKTDLVTRTVIPPPGEGEKALYAFGVYHGLDGKEHLGIDRLRRPDRGEMFVSPPPGGRPFSM